jgi:hypothetical protein
MVVVAKSDLAGARRLPLVEFKQLDSRAMVGTPDPDFFGDYPGTPV